MSTSRPRWCPTCGRLTYSAEGYCPAHERTAGERLFGNCRYCGRTIDRKSTTCMKCRGLVALDSIPPDALESLPMQADELAYEGAVKHGPAERADGSSRAAADGGFGSHVSGAAPTHAPAREDRVTEA